MNNQKDNIIEDKLYTEILRVYIEENNTKEDTAKILNISMWYLSKLMREYNIKKDKSLILEMRKKTCLDRYGYEHSASSPAIKKKIVDSNIEKYGVEHPSKLQETIKKRKRTKLEKYGDENYNNVEQNKLTKKIKYNNENYNNREKYKDTMLNLYGEDNSFKLKKTKNIITNNILNKSNYSNIFKDLYEDKQKAAAFLKSKNYSYFDLVKIFNAPYYTIQNWVVRMGLKNYINYKFEGKSNYENEIVAFLESIGITNIRRNVTDILKNKEIDIYIEDAKIGIEFNGDYWHSDLFKHNKYHQQKSIEASLLNIRLIHIYEHEWLGMRDKIKTLIKIALGKYNTKVFARNCNIKQISNREAREFNDNNHLQNHRNAQITYGLFYNNELVQLMSFSKTRYNKNLKTDNSWEIIRGCPGSNNIVVGGVSKLFTHFVRDYNPDNVFSYCDFNKFNGNSYEQLGMKLIGITGPDLKYIINGKIVKRQPNKYKEIKNMIDYRLYGAGSKKYLWKKEEK